MKKKVVFVFVLVLLTVGVFAQQGYKRLKSITLNGVDMRSGYTGRVLLNSGSYSESVSLFYTTGEVETYVFIPGVSAYEARMTYGNSKIISTGTAEKIRIYGTQDTLWRISFSTPNGVATVSLSYGD